MVSQVLRVRRVVHKGLKGQKGQLEHLVLKGQREPKGQEVLKDLQELRVLQG